MLGKAMHTPQNQQCASVCREHVLFPEAPNRYQREYFLRLKTLFSYIYIYQTRICRATSGIVKKSKMSPFTCCSSIGFPGPSPFPGKKHGLDEDEGTLWHAWLFMGFLCFSFFLPETSLRRPHQYKFLWGLSFMPYAQRMSFPTTHFVHAGPKGLEPWGPNSNQEPMKFMVCSCRTSKARLPTTSDIVQTQLRHPV